jgi:hypothetical protein
MNRPGAHFQAVAGHLVDLYRLATFRFLNPHSYTKFRQLKNVARQVGARTVIETGTYRGVTARRCSSAFERVYTIELDQALAAESTRYLADRKNVEVIQGDGLVKLPEVMARPDVKDVLVFLDGHFSEGITAKGDHAEPAVLEVIALGQFKEKLRGIVIDDFRLFGAVDGYPPKSVLVRSIEEHFPGWNLAVHLDQVIVTPPATKQ